MTSSAPRLLPAVALAVVLSSAGVIGQSGADSADAHVAAAKAAAGQDHLGLFDRVCTAATPAPAAPPRRRRADRHGPPDRSQWHVGAGEGLRQPLFRR